MKSLVPWKRDEKRSDLARFSDDPLWQFRDRMNRYLDSFWRNPFELDLLEENDIFLPRIDLSETDQEYTVIVDLPGMDEKDIDLSYNRNVLSISGKKEQEK
jgi:HSP20 family protein